jgi:hypothetical protein
MRLPPPKPSPEPPAVLSGRSFGAEADGTGRAAGPDQVGGSAMARVLTVGSVRGFNFMNIPTKQNPIPKAIALILVSIVAAWLVKRYDVSALAKIDSTSPTDYIQHQRELHQHAYAFHFIVYLIMGGFYIGVIEFIAYVVGLFIPKKPDA